MAVVQADRPQTPRYVISPEDREILRPLAARVAHFAARPLEDEKRRLWTAHNALEDTRPLIFCDPEGGWREILPDSALTCAGQLARGWERHLRGQIFYGEQMKDDRVIEPFFGIGHVHEQTDWGLHEERVGGDHGGSYRWEAPMKSYDMLDQLRFPTITVDYAATDELLALANATFGDLLPAKLNTIWWWTLGMTWTAANIRGLEQIMLDMYDEPENFHRLMAFLRDGTMARIDFLEKNGLLYSNARGHYVGSGGFGFTREIPVPPAGPAHLSNMWGFCESQETVGISPEMFEEFIFPYQKPLLERFALNCYGCCEPLNTRWDVVKKLPRLRRVSVAPMANIEKMAENLSNRYVYSLKANPADLAMPVMNEDVVRQRLRHALAATRGCRLEIIMKDNHTLGGDPRHATRWVEIAREEITRAYPHS